MSRTLAIAVILALHVTASLCELPQPEQELVDKYTELKKDFKVLFQHYFDKVKDHVDAKIESPETKAKIEGLQGDPHVQKAIKFATDMGAELSPMLDKARMTALGLYGEYIRPWAQPYMEKIVKIVSDSADKVLLKQDA